MNKIVLSAAACVLGSALAFSAPALAQQGPGNGPGSFAAENFSDQKARVLRMLEVRKTRLEQKKTCVEAAQSREELLKCRPERPGGDRGPGSMGGGQGRQGQTRGPQ